jgi:hypothetical protein
MNRIAVAMQLDPDEDATIRAFVAPAKRARFLELLANPKRRGRGLGEFNHFTGWDARHVHAVKSSADVEPVLRAAGAPEMCHVISNDARIDGRDLPLREAVSRAEDFDSASILCCDPGRVAFFFDEARVDRLRLLLRRARKGR